MLTAWRAASGPQQLTLPARLVAEISLAAGRALQQTHMCVYGGCTNVAAGASVAVTVARAKRRRVTKCSHFKGWFRILDVGPHLQVSQRAVYQWRLLQHISSSPSSSAQFAGAKLAQGDGLCRPANENTPSHSAVHQRQINYNGGLSM